MTKKKTLDLKTFNSLVKMLQQPKGSDSYGIANKIIENCDTIFSLPYLIVLANMFPECHIVGRVSNLKEAMDLLINFEKNTPHRYTIQEKHFIIDNLPIDNLTRTRVTQVINENTQKRKGKFDIRF